MKLLEMKDFRNSRTRIEYLICGVGPLSSSITIEGVETPKVKPFAIYNDTKK